LCTSRFEPPADGVKIGNLHLGFNFVHRVKTKSKDIFHREDAKDAKKRNTRLTTEDTEDTEVN
ncbi:MAG: hypothetical protein ABSH22_18520, partial [Tepidisphaeraceae bacterium]